MKSGQFYLILFILFITHGTCYLMGRNAESRENENEIELSMEAAAQQYKNQANDTTGFYYGIDNTKTDTTRRVLPQNTRTKSHIPTATKNKALSQTRKRN